MTIVVDLDRKTITAPVGDLVDEEAPRRIGLGGARRSRLRLGQRLHARLQAELAAGDPRFRAEVPVRAVREVDGWRVEIHGRADGVVEDGGSVLEVDEIKTIRSGPGGGPSPAELDRFRRQVRLYAWLLARPPVLPAARLLLVDIATGTVRTEEVPWSPEAVQVWLRAAVHRIVTVERRRREILAHGRRIASQLPFPHETPRPHQRPMMEAVERALPEGRPLLLEAPTGSGKTAAVLYPALRFALETGRRLVHLTFTTLQQRPAVETLRPMAVGIAALQIRAKAKMCAHTEMVCHEDVCPYASGYSGKVEGSGLIPRLLDGAGMIEPDGIFEAATAVEACPFEVSLDLLSHVRAVVCDANYVVDPGIGLDSLLDAEPSGGAVLVIDEAHNLVDRARSLYSPRIDGSELAAAIEHLDGIGGGAVPLREVLETYAGWLRRTAEPVEGAPPGTETIIELDTGAFAEPLLELEEAFLGYLMFKREHELWIADDPAVAAFSSITRFAAIAELEGEELVPTARAGEDGEPSAGIVCLDPSRFLGPLLSRAGGLVAMSGTLRPFEHLSDMAGLSPFDPETFTLPSPFPPENRLVVAITDVDTTWRGRRASSVRAGRWIARLAVPGRNVLVLFPSYAYLRMVLDVLPPVPHRLLVQERGAPGPVNREILGALASGGGHLLLAVMGGMYAEGVDYPGEMLSEVIVVSPGLPAVSMERKLLREFLQERYGRGFEYAFLVPGMTRVVQAAGRLIRSETDRGAIVLIGRRFLRPPYVGLLPPDWTGGNPSSLAVPDPAAAVHAFLGTQDPPGSGQEGADPDR